MPDRSKLITTLNKKIIYDILLKLDSPSTASYLKTHKLRKGIKTETLRQYFSALQAARFIRIADTKLRTGKGQDTMLRMSNFIVYFMPTEKGRSYIQAYEKLIQAGRIIKVVTRDELASIEQSKSVLRMVVPNLSEAGLNYLRALGSVSVESGSVAVSGFEGDPSVVSAELMRRGFLLREFSLEKTSLEEYFFRLVEESKGSQAAA